MKKAKLLMRMVSVAMTAAMFTQAMITGAVAKDIEAKTTGTTYYVDSTSGNDENNGTSENAPWKSLEKVNSTVFQPGDQILFKTGSRYEGQLAPQGSGEEGAPIIINMYGDGEEKPIIDGMGREGDRTILDNDGAAIVLQNQDYWEINNLEVTNQSDKMGERFGILIRWHNYGTGEHVYIKDCYIHDISGMYQNGVTEYEEDGSVVNKNRFMGDGIMVVATGTPESEGGVPTNFNDILIEGNRLEEIYRTGITIWSQWTDRPGAPLYYPGADGKLTFHSTVGKYVANTNVIVRENQLDTMAGDGILINTCDGALVEYNTVANCNYYSKSDPNAGVWPHNSDNTIMQYNEVYGTRTTADGQSFDVDMNCDNTIIQYNYSHDNEGGFLLIMHDAHNITVRYNISENDGCGLFDWRGYDTRVYNNTFYMTSPLYRTVSGSGELYNNIFYSSEENKAQDWKSMTYKNNCYYNFANTPNDSNAVTAAPLLSAPGVGNVDGYQLSENSPCINGGLFMQNNGSLDYFGNQLDDVPDIGAADTQTAGEAKYEINYAFNCPVTVSDSLEGWGWSSQYLTDGNFGSGNILGWTTNSRESVNEDHFAEIDLGKVVPINKLVLTNSGGAFPADFTISVYQDETQKWKQVVTETGYEAHSPESKIPETFGLEEAVYGSKVRIDITKLTQKSDGIYAQIGEFEVYYIDKSGLGETIAKVEENSELVEALGEILNTAKEVYKKPVGEVTYTELLQQQTLLDKLMQMYTQDPLRFTLNVKIQEMKSILENDVDAWGPAKTMFEETISWASKIVNDNEASEEEIEKSVKALESALEDFQSAEDYSYTNIVDDFENWNYMYQKGETIFLEPANATNGGRNSVMSNPASSEENYLVYKINKLKSVSFLNALPRGFSDTEPIRLYVSSNNDTYISLENVQVEEITEQIPKRKYTCTDIPENMNYLKIELPDGYTWEYSIQHVVLEGTQELKELLVQAPEKLTYTQGEELDLTGMQITAKYIDTTEQVVAVESCQITGFDSEALGTQIVTVSYTENGITKMASFDVTIETAPVEKENLEYLINKAHEAEENGELENVVESAVKVFHEAVANGETVMSDESATEEEVFDACWKLLQALGGLGIYQGDKGLLEQAVVLAEKLDLTLYVEAGQEEFQNALEKAKAVLESEDATQKSVDEFRTALLNAMSALRMKADKSALKALLKQMESVNLSSYTTESVQAFKVALSEAKVIMADLTLSESDQKIIDEAVAELNQAYDALEKKTSSEQNQSNHDKQESEKFPIVNTGNSAVGVFLAIFLMLTASAVWICRKRKVI